MSKAINALKEHMEIEFLKGYTYTEINEMMNELGLKIKQLEEENETFKNSIEEISSENEILGDSNANLRVKIRQFEEENKRLKEERQWIDINSKKPKGNTMIEKVFTCDQCGDKTIHPIKAEYAIGNKITLHTKNFMKTFTVCDNCCAEIEQIVAGIIDGIEN